MTTKNTFFKANVFQLLANELQHRYYLRGTFGLTIGMSKLNKTDTGPLRALLGYTPIAWSKKKAVSIIEFEQAIKNSAVGWDLAEFIFAITEKNLVLKADIEAATQRQFLEFLSCLDNIDPIFTKNLSSQQLYTWFNKKELAFDIFHIVAKTLKELPTTYTRMPVFAYQQTGNPHTFDDNRSAGILLTQMLTAITKVPAETQMLTETERKNQLLDTFCLLRDDIKNNVAARGLVGKKQQQRNEMWHQACLENCSWNIPLKEILLMDEIYPFNGEKVLIVENSGIYSILVEDLPKIPIVCSSGQFTYSVWKLLRKLASNDTQMYYVGDMDPEGLVMAQQLLQKFPQNFRTISMNLANYQIASNLVQINEQRMKQLRLVKDPQLKEIADQIRKTNKVAMQEGFLVELIEEVKKIFIEK